MVFTIIISVRIFLGVTLILELISYRKRKTLRKAFSLRQLRNLRVGFNGATIFEGLV